MRYLLFILLLVSCSKNEIDRVEFIPQNVIEWEDNEKLLFNMINEYRIDNNVQKIIPDDVHYELAINRNYENIEIGTISHEKFSKTFRILIHSGLNWAGENLAFGYTKNESVLKAWIKSERHNKNLLREDWVYGGLSIIQDNKYKYYCLILSK